MSSEPQAPGLDDVDRRLLAQLTADPRLSKSELAKITGLARSPEVAECHRITGDDCFVMRVHASGMAALEELLDRFLVHGLTNTAIVVSTPVAPRPLPVVPGRVR